MANLLTLISAVLASDGLTLTCTIGGTVVLPLTYTTGFQMSIPDTSIPNRVAEIIYSPIAHSVVGSTIVLTFPVAIRASIVCEVYYTPGDLTDSVGSTMAQFRDVAITNNSTQYSSTYSVLATSKLCIFQVGDNGPVTCQFTAYDLQSNAVVALPIVSCVCTIYNLSTNAIVPGYSAVSASILTPTGYPVTVEVLANCNPNVISPTPLVAGSYMAVFTGADANGVQFGGACPITVVSLA